MNSDWPSAEELMKMAQEQPEELEALRQREVERLIEKAPKEMQRRLRGLQFQIDCKRATHSTPIGACISISQMMLESFTQLNDALNGNPSEIQDEPHAAKRRKADKTTNVIQFPETAV